MTANTNDRWEVMTFTPLGICLNCFWHRQGNINDKVPTCKAFPRGIPRVILDGNFDHRLPYADDHGIQFLQDPERPEPNWDEQLDLGPEGTLFDE